jgi:hypothetical protein
MPAGLHKLAKASAKRNKRSLNSELLIAIAEYLETIVDEREMEGQRKAALRRVNELLAKAGEKE